MSSGIQDIYIARQAIYNPMMGVYAYELLYRDSHNNRAVLPDALMATSQVLSNTFMELGLDNLVGRHKAFFNLPQSFFSENPPIPFDKERIVLELLEDLTITEPVFRSIKALKQAGYTIAIDDYLFESKWEPLLELVDIIKVEIPGLSNDLLAQKIQPLKSRNLLLLAEKVESQAVFQGCKDLGFDLFQGYFFSRPNIIKGRKLDDNHLTILQLLSKLNDPNASMDVIERLVTYDAGLSYKILRFINSASVGLPRKVDAIRQAIIYMGINRIRTWASLIAMSGIKNKSSDLITLALIRALMCERLSRACRKGNPEQAFTAGLFSLLDVMLDQPMETILQQLPLPDEIKLAITRHQGDEGRMLRCATAYEAFNWDVAYLDDLDTSAVQRIYWESVAQAEQAAIQDL